MLANVIFQTSLCLTDCPAILLDESSEGMHSVFAISSRLPSGSASEWAGDSNPARWSYILQEHSFGTGTTVGQRRLGMSIQTWRVCVCVTDRQCKVFDARPCMLGLLVCNRVAVRILAKTPGLSARAHEVQRWDSQVQSLLTCCEVHLWTGRKSSCPVPCNYHSFLKFQQAVQRCTQDSHSIKVGRCFQILGILLPKFQNYVCQNDSQLIQSDRDRWRFFASMYCNYVLVVLKESWRQTWCWFDCTGRPFWFKPSHDFEFFLEPLDPWQQAVIAARFCKALLNLRIRVGRVQVASVSFQFWGSILQITWWAQCRINSASKVEFYEGFYSLTRMNWNWMTCNREWHLTRAMMWLDGPKLSYGLMQGIRPSRMAAAVMQSVT